MNCSGTRGVDPNTRPIPCNTNPPPTHAQGTRFRTAARGRSGHTQREFGVSKHKRTEHGRNPEQHDYGSKQHVRRGQPHGRHCSRRRRVAGSVRVAHSTRYLAPDAFALQNDRVARSRVQPHNAVRVAQLQKKARKLRKMDQNVKAREQTIRQDRQELEQLAKYVNAGFKEVNRVRSFNAFKTQQLNDTLKTVQELVAKLPRCYHCYGFNVTSQYAFACGHMCLCEQCFDQMQASNDPQNAQDPQCPVCKQHSKAFNIIPYK